jgi:hypothetical protein
MRSKSGIARSFEIIVASAIDSTTTIAAVADSPPMNTTSASHSICSLIGSASTNVSGTTLPPGKRNRPPSAIGSRNRLSRNE